MDKAVADTHCLLGSQLRDPDSGRLGRIVGIDQSREAPALLVNWGQSGVERVALSVTELSDLVTASLAHERNVRENVREDRTVSERQPSRAAEQAHERTRRDQPAGRARDDEAAPNVSSSAATGAVDYRPLATGSDGRR
ncbi:MAG: hypothetical protein WCD50_10485 [Onishia taeanensis]|uniref:Uncharacterized protein n=1 Tax=Onishia taeanensis TaxID=284577 RepID=A0A328XT48_9GAMM|nr:MULTISPECIES: hypothetical protein [Halomonas]RAR63129.1 hypothetical protein BCL93_103362 [Halomonas taeanensis]